MPTLNNSIFAITADTGLFGRQAQWLCESINRQYPGSEILVFIPDGSLDDMSDDRLNWFQDRTSVVSDKIPIPSYPQSAMIRAFELAAQRGDSEYIVGLDTDTIMLSRISLPDDIADVYVKPADLGARYWGSHRSYDKWKAVYNHYDLEFPRETVTSTVDKRQIPPYWNAGVIVTTDPTLPTDWLRVTMDIIHSNIVNFETEEQRFFSDQVALPIALENRSVTPLSERQNYPLPLRFSVPASTEILHTHHPAIMGRIHNSHIVNELENIGVDIPSLEIGDYLQQYLHILLHRSGRVLNFRHKNGLKRFGKRLMDYLSNMT